MGPAEKITEFIFWSNISRLLFLIPLLRHFSPFLRHFALQKSPIRFNQTLLFFPPLEIMSATEPEMIAGSATTVMSTGLSASTVFLSLLVPALVLYYIYFKISRRHMIELAEKLPGPDGLPLIGNMLMLLGSSDSKAT